jgi:transcriptional regulator with XRE-family HTH domain
MSISKALINTNSISFLEVGNNIRKWRNLKGIKQEYLADQLGITKVAMSKIETGKTDIPLKRLLEISKVLELKIIYLFTDPCELINLL